MVNNYNIASLWHTNFPVVKTEDCNFAVILDSNFSYIPNCHDNHLLSVFSFPGNFTAVWIKPHFQRHRMYFLLVRLIHTTGREIYDVYFLPSRQGIYILSGILAHSPLRRTTPLACEGFLRGPTWKVSPQFPP